MVMSFSDFKLEIPNGDNVPNPCVANTKWKAPGHTNILGGGKRNPFGEDFDKAGRVSLLYVSCYLSYLLSLILLFTMSINDKIHLKRYGLCNDMLLLIFNT